MDSYWIRARGSKPYRALLCPAARFAKTVATVGAICLAVLLDFLGALGIAGAGSVGTPDFAISVSPATISSPLGLTTPLDNVTVDAAAVGAQIQTGAFGVNMNVCCDVTDPPSQGALLVGAGVKIIRWPGGTNSDLYHWQTNTLSSPNACGFYGPGPVPPPPVNSSFDSFMQNFVIPNHFDVAITLNYGTNATCDGPADPNEAIAWVDYANKQRGYGIRYWSVGNEVFFPASEPDLHINHHDAATYANEVANQIYPGIKAKDPTAQVGVVVTGIQGPSNWDPIVLQNAPYDFVELHFYPQSAGQEDDTFLLTQAPPQFVQSLNKVKQELAAVSRANTPIMVGEFNSVSGDPGKQSVSIVNALYMGMALSEILKAGVQIATVFGGFTGSCGVGNQSPSLYGWQNFGSYNLFSARLPTQSAWPGCPNAQPTPFGTPFPNARAYQLAALFAQPGEHMLATNHTQNVRAYAATQGSGYALFLFNLDKDNPVTISAAIANQAKTSFTGQAYIYDRAIYDLSQNGTWAGPSTSLLGALTNPFPITLTPWSMTVVVLSPNDTVPVISVTPSSHDFGNVTVGGSSDKDFNVQNVGGGTLSGSASTSLPFSIVSGGSYSLTGGQNQNVTVRFTPTSAIAFNGNVSFTGGGGASNTVIGTGVPVPLALAGLTLSTGEVNVPFSAPLVSGGLAPFNITRKKGAFPPGLGGDSATGNLTGIPSGSKTATFTVQVSDHLGSSVTGTFKFKIVKAVRISTRSLKAGKQGKAYNAVLKATGGATPYTWALLPGNAPAWLNFDGATGKITGTPTSPGSYNPTFQVTDNLGGQAQRTLTLTVK